MAGFRGGMGELMRQASRMQRKVEARKEELKANEYEASAGNDQVKAKVNGAQEVLRIEVAPQLLTDDLELAQDMIVAAINAALAKSRDNVEAELEKVTGGLKIPGLT